MKRMTVKEFLEFASETDKWSIYRDIHPMSPRPVNLKIDCGDCRPDYTCPNCYLGGVELEGEIAVVACRDCVTISTLQHYEVSRAGFITNNYLGIEYPFSLNGAAIIYDGGVSSICLSELEVNRLFERYLPQALKTFDYSWVNNFADCY